MAFERMLDQACLPDPQTVLGFIGSPVGVCWESLDRFLRDAYQIEPEPRFDKAGWTLRYRKGGRPLCDVLPEAGAFTVLVVLGGKEGEQALSALDTFGPTVRDCLANARAYHDGRWLWIRVQTARDAEDVQRLVMLKRKPKNF